MIIDHPDIRKLIDPGTFIEPKNWWVGSMCFLLFYYYYYFFFGSNLDLYFLLFKIYTYSRFARVSKKNLDSHKCKLMKFPHISTFPAKGHELKDIMIFTLFQKSSKIPCERCLGTLIKTPSQHLFGQFQPKSWIEVIQASRRHGLGDLWPSPWQVHLSKNSTNCFFWGSCFFSRNGDQMCCKWLFLSNFRGPRAVNIMGKSIPLMSHWFST